MRLQKDYRKEKHRKHERNTDCAQPLKAGGLLGNKDTDLVSNP